MLSSPSDPGLTAHSGAPVQVAPVRVIPSSGRYTCEIHRTIHVGARPGRLSCNKIHGSKEETGEREIRFVDRIAGDQDVEQEMLDSADRAAIRSAVGALPVPQRRLIEQHFFEEISLARIADELGLSRQGAYVRQRLIL